MLTAFLISVPPAPPAILIAVAPGLLMALAGHRIGHAMYVASAKSWRR